MMRASIAVNTSDQLNFIQFFFIFVTIVHFVLTIFFIVQRLDICLGKEQRAINESNVRA